MQSKDLWIPNLARLMRLAVSGLLLACAAMAQAVELNQEVETLDGRTLPIQAWQQGKPMYLKFWASWCKPCMAEMPHLQHIQQQYGDKISVVAVNIDLNESDEAIQQVIQAHQLSMPVVKDSQGQLAKAFNMIGTPYHILLDADSRVVHKGNEANETLDNKFAFLLKRDGRLSETNLFDRPGDPASLPLTDDINLIFYTATWCDWYLADTRPELSEYCKEQQQALSETARQRTGINWLVVVNHLWTTDEDKKSFTDRYNLTMPVVIDEQGEQFFASQIRQVPTLLVTRGTEILYRTDSVEKAMSYLDSL